MTLMKKVILSDTLSTQYKRKESFCGCPIYVIKSIKKKIRFWWGES